MGPARRLKSKKRMERKFAASVSSEEGFDDWWQVFSRRIAGNLSPLKGLDTFQSVFNMSRRTFDYICSLAKEHMTEKSVNFKFSNGQLMSLNDQVALALRRLSSGNSLITIGDSVGAHHSTVSQVTWRFVEAIEEKGLHHLQWPSSEQEMADIKSKFESIQGLPNCCGAVDATHVTMMLASSEPSADVWLDSRENHSMILQAIVDPDLRFRDVVSGWPGKMSKSSVLENSTFFKRCDDRERLNGKRIKIPHQAELREYIVGDFGFPLLPWVLTPYQGEGLSEHKTKFNKRLLETHLVARRALARLKEVWKIIQGVMWRPDKHKLPRVILACCILHNIVIDMGDEVLDAFPLSDIHDPGYEEEVCESIDATATVLRDKLCLLVQETALSG